MSCLQWLSAENLIPAPSDGGGNSSPKSYRVNFKSKSLCQNHCSELHMKTWNLLFNGNHTKLDVQYRDINKNISDVFNIDSFDVISVNSKIMLITLNSKNLIKFGLLEYSF